MQFAPTNSALTLALIGVVACMAAALFQRRLHADQRDEAGSCARRPGPHPVFTHVLCADVSSRSGALGGSATRPASALADRTLARSPHAGGAVVSRRSAARTACSGASACPLAILRPQERLARPGPVPTIDKSTAGGGAWCKQPILEARLRHRGALAHRCRCATPIEDAPAQSRRPPFRASELVPGGRSGRRLRTDLVVARARANAIPLKLRPPAGVISPSCILLQHQV